MTNFADRFTCKNVSFPPPIRSSYRWIARPKNFSIKIANDRYEGNFGRTSQQSRNWKNGCVTGEMYKNREYSAAVDGFQTGDIRPKPQHYWKENSRRVDRLLVENGERNSYIRYDPYSHNLVKTIDLGVPIVSLTTTSKMTADMDYSSVTVSSSCSSIIRQQPTVRGGIVSQFRLVRRPNTAKKPTVLSTVVKRPSHGRMNGSHSGNRVISKTISQYKIRRRSCSSTTRCSFASYVTRKQPRPDWKPTVWKQRGNHFRTPKNLYKFVKRVSPKRPAKSLYKIDRRHERTLRISEANKLRNRALHRVWKRNPKKPVAGPNDLKLNTNSKSKTKQCLFYVRYGRCSRGTSCPFIHDPEKIVVCTRYLRGTCGIQDCPFSHVASPDKMPLCRFFELGKCNRPDCPYLHIKHAVSAKNCGDFERGFCPKGAKCDKKHTARNGKRKKERKTNDQQKADSLDQSASMNGGKAAEANNKDLRKKRKHRSITMAKKESGKRVSTDALPDFIPLNKVSTKRT